MTKIVLSDNAISASWLKNLLIFYLNSENIKKEWKEFSFQDADKLARLLAKYLDIDADAEKSPFDEIAQKILDFLSREDFEASSKVPPQIRELVKEYEEALVGLEEKDKPAIIRQKAAQKVQAYLEFQEKLARTRKITDELAAGSASKLNKSPLLPDIPEEAIGKIMAKLPKTAEGVKDYSEAWRQAVDETVQELQEQGVISEAQVTFLKVIEPPALTLPIQEAIAFSPEQLSRITEVVVSSLETDENLQVLVEKTVSPEEITKAWQEYVERTYTQKIAPVLEKEGLPVLVETLIATEPSPETMATILTETKKAPEARTNTADWFTAQFSPLVLPPKETEKLVETLIPVIASNLPEIETKNDEEVRAIVQETIIVSLAQTTPYLLEQGITLTPRKVEQIVARLTPRAPAEIKAISALISLPQEDRVLVLEKSSALTIKTTAAGQITALYKRVTSGNLLHVRTTDEVGNQKETFTEQIKSVIRAEGINSQTAPKLKDLLEGMQCLYLTAEGITPTEIDHTIEELQKRGLKADAPEIKELQGIRNTLSAFQEKAPWVTKKQQAVNRQNAEPVRVPFSNNATLIERKTPFKPPRIPNFLSKIFGNKGLFKDRFVFISQTRAAVTKQYRLIKSQVSSRFKNWFFATGLGKTVKLGLEKVGQKSLQGLWQVSKTGIQKAVSKGITSLITKFAPQLLNVVIPGVGAIGGAIISWAATKVIPLIKKGLKALVGGFGLANSVASGLIGGDYSAEDDKDLKFAGAGVLIAIVVFPILAIIILITSFFNFPQRPVEPIPGIQGELQCNPSRHYSEEVLCRLYSDDDNCKLKDNLGIVNITYGVNWNKAKKCLETSNLTRKNDLIKKFEESVIGDEVLQCAGFAVGVEAGLGRELESKHAKRYLDSSTKGYILYNKSNPLPSNSPDKGLKKGDLLIWRETANNQFGHIVVFLEMKGNVNITGAEANGNNGRVGVIDNRVFVNFSEEGSPDGLLRPN